jgi:hypothetical protein
MILEYIIKNMEERSGTKLSNNRDRYSTLCPNAEFRQVKRHTTIQSLSLKQIPVRDVV